MKNRMIALRGMTDWAVSVMLADRYKLGLLVLLQRGALETKGLFTELYT